jgi:hypothetical protein
MDKEEAEKIIRMLLLGKKSSDERNAVINGILFGYTEETIKKLKELFNENRILEQKLIKGEIKL